MTPGRKPSISASARSTSRSTTSAASRCLRSSATEGRPRASDVSGSGGALDGGRSIRITSAPRSASSMAAKGAGPIPASSTTLRSRSGPWRAPLTPRAAGRAPPRPHNTTTSPRRARRSESAGDRSRGNARLRAVAASCRSSPPSRTRGTCGGAPSGSRSCRHSSQPSSGSGSSVTAIGLEMGAGRCGHALVISRVRAAESVVTLCTTGSKRWKPHVVKVSGCPGSRAVSPSPVATSPRISWCAAGGCSRSSRVNGSMPTSRS